ncbi:MAG: 50S ribosomal protein L18 [Phycisphaerales bacterium]|nr:50S ribosomal protein L18 [Phycisphaerae bacterium]NNF44708.1 50S ribosomal protein L18 [Phycisphaerales bacterium]NNM25245.1 50S ribosomal protein L18 [Phycisphaerales bacterium]
MNRIELKKRRHERRKRGIRRRLLGVPNRPRLTVFRSAKHIYAQVIDDLSGRTLVAASTNEKSGKAANGGNCEAAKQVGDALAERAKQAGIDAVIFDRNGYRFHGRIKALADAARKGGLKF